MQDDAKVLVGRGLDEQIAYPVAAMRYLEHLHEFSRPPTPAPPVAEEPTLAARMNEAETFFLFTRTMAFDLPAVRKPDANDVPAPAPRKVEDPSAADAPISGICRGAQILNVSVSPAADPEAVKHLFALAFHGALLRALPEAIRQVARENQAQFESGQALQLMCAQRAHYKQPLPPSRNLAILRDVLVAQGRFRLTREDAEKAANVVQPPVPSMPTAPLAQNG